MRLQDLGRVVNFPALAGRTYLAENREYQASLVALASLYQLPLESVRQAFRARCVGSDLHWRKVYLLVTTRYDLRFLDLLGALMPKDKV